MDWIKNISDLIKKTIQGVRKPVPSIPPILLLCEIMNRPGLSAISLTASTITRLTTNGYETGVAECGIENMDNKFIKIMVEETIKHIKDYGRVDTVVQPMELSFIATGGNAGGPVVLSLYNTNMAEFGGIPE